MTYVTDYTVAYEQNKVEADLTANKMEVSSVINHETEIQKHVWRKPLGTPFFFSSPIQVPPGTRLLLQEGNVKQEVLGGWRCRYQHAERAVRPGKATCDPPPRDWRIRAGNRIRRMECMSLLRVGLDMLWGLSTPRPLPQLEKGRPSKKVMRCSNTHTILISETWGQGCIMWVMRYVLEQAVTSRYQSLQNNWNAHMKNGRCYFFIKSGCKKSKR